MAFERHRDKNGQMNLISTLRKHYGPDFAYWCADTETLGDVLQKLDEPSLSTLVCDDESGKLERICREAA